MRLLRLIILAIFVAPHLGSAQSAPEVEVTSGVINEATLPVVPDPPVEEEIALVDPVAATAPEAPLSPLAPAASLRPVMRDAWAVPAARWDGHPRGPAWTAAVLAALRGPGAPLLNVVPRDIRAWCPGYEQASTAQRAAFWTGLISTLAWHESTHSPTAIGGGGRWFGLVQIAPGTARWRDCDVESGQSLLHGPANLRCGIRIMAITVPRDNVISEGMRGVAADWGPFHSTRKREDMRNWVVQQEYCQLPPSPTRPVMRPAGLGEDLAAQLAPVSGPMAATVMRPVQRPVVQ